MSVQISWFDDLHTILYHRYRGAWTIAAYRQALEQTYALLDECDGEVDVILDLSGADTSFARLVAEVSASPDKYAEARVHPNQRLAIIVGADLFCKTAINMGVRYTPRMARSLLFVDSLDEAVAILADYGAIHKSYIE